VNRLPKTVTGQRSDCDWNPGPSAPESSTLTTTRLPSHPRSQCSAEITERIEPFFLQYRLPSTYSVHTVFKEIRGQSINQSIISFRNFFQLLSEIRISPSAC